MYADGFADVFAGLSVAPAVAAIVAAGALAGAVHFAAWVTGKVSEFFDDFDEEEISGEWVCSFCGEVQDEEAYCMHYSGGCMCALCSKDDSRWADDEE